MKKLFIIALALVLTLSLAACGRKGKNDNNTTPNNGSSVMPSTDPTKATNVPDPDVEGAVPDGTDGMDSIVDDITGNNDNATGNGTHGNGTNGNGTDGGAMGSTNGNTGSAGK